jgi:Fe2+ or Zn2+ uptake regulation protein
MMERQTKQKTMIYDTLTKLDHPTATEVYNDLHVREPSVSRATVFRVLGGFVASGKAREIRVAGTDVRYDFTVAPHSHVRCTRCGKVADVWLKNAAFLEEDLRAGNGFEVESYSVEFYGVCPHCKAAESGRES